MKTIFTFPRLVKKGELNPNCTLPYRNFEEKLDEYIQQFKASDLPMPLYLHSKMNGSVEELFESNAIIGKVISVDDISATIEVDFDSIKDIAHPGISINSSIEKVSAVNQYIIVRKILSISLAEDNVHYKDEGDDSAKTT